MTKKSRARAADPGAAASSISNAAVINPDGGAPQDLATAATDLARRARAMVIEPLGRALTGEQHAHALHALRAGAPLAVSIRLTVPQAVTVWLAGEPLAHVVFEPETVQ
jgi:hypothetical protein